MAVARRLVPGRGLVLLRNERMAFRIRTVAALHGEQSMWRGLVDSGRKVLAGVLLMVPGVVSDLLALLLLALPLNVGRHFASQPAGPVSPSRPGFRHAGRGFPTQRIGGRRGAYFMRSMSVGCALAARR